MRILHIFDHSLPLQSGYVTRSLGILRSQRARGWNTLQLTTPRHPADGATSETIEGFTFYRTPKVSFRSPFLRELAEIYATYRVLVHLVRVHKPDVLHAHSPVLNVIPAILAGRQFNLPVVYEVRALWEDAAVDHGTTREGALRYRLSRMADSWAMRHVDCVAPISESLRGEIAARGIPSDRIVVVPNAVDKSLLSRKVPGTRDQNLRQGLGLTGQIVLGFVGSFYAYEGLDLLLSAAVKLRKQGVDVSVLLVGGGPHEARLRSLADELGLTGCVRFAGSVHHSEVQRYYDQIDILVFPRRRMRLTELVTPLKPLEGMAQIIPVVASDVGGHRELIVDGQTGYLFQPDDSDVLAHRLQEVIAAPRERRRVAEAGRLYVETERTWKHATDRHAEIYTKVERETPLSRESIAPQYRPSKRWRELF